MKNRIQIFVGSFCLATVSLATEVKAAPPQPAQVLKHACNGLTPNAMGEIVLPRHRIAEAILIGAGRSPSEILASSDAVLSPDSYRTYLNTLYQGIDSSGLGHPKDDADSNIFRGINLVANFLHKSGAIGNEPAIVKDASKIPTRIGTPWLFDSKYKVVILCGSKAATPTQTTIQEVQKVAEKPRLAIRAKPEDFSLGGDEREKADSFKIGLEKVWKTDDDGVEKRTTTLKVNGAIGYRLTSFDPVKNRSTTSAYVFANYNLERKRDKPATPLAEGKRRNENDTNALAIGFVADGELTKNESEWKVFGTTSTSYVTNFVDNSGKLRARSLIEFLSPKNASPFCTFGRGFQLGIGGLVTRCNIKLDIESAIQTKRGLADPTKFDSYIAAGALGSIQIFSPNGKKTQSLGEVSYRRLAILYGTAPKIERFEATLKQRYWFQSDAAMDLGFSYTNGNNELTLEDEKKLSFEIGFLF
ncbi:MAG: hypothetical protein ABJN65_00650 [Parasphingorhabdus sp.]